MLPLSPARRKKMALNYETTELRSERSFPYNAYRFQFWMAALSVIFRSSLHLGRCYADISLGAGKYVFFSSSFEPRLTLHDDGRKDTRGETWKFASWF